ncbi:vestitone reductase-like [Cornus florida]|uniref:vestitone reductase-like n=1 Tax=Cornus florida TaxID=4283 RepID=UPI00289CA685|nr:vestitone reductase-like [Cornus florida]
MLRERDREREMAGVDDDDKGIVCVTGGTGFLASWLIKKLLQHGYSVRTTIRSDPDKKKDVSFLTNLPGAPEKLQIFNADLEQPGSFDAAIEGCIGVFHVAHPIDLEDKEPEEVKTRRAINGTLSILQACLDSKTVKRVVYTSSASTVVFNDKGLEEMDESTWSDMDFIREHKLYAASYMISKQLTERAALKFAEEHGLDLVTVIPSFIVGPFICPRCPGSVYTSLSMIFGDKDQYRFIANAPLVHVDDVASAHIFLLEYPDPKGRYICSALEVTNYQMSEYLSARYPQYQIPNADSLKEFEGGIKYSGLSSKKLLDAGFKFKYGLDGMYDEAIQCCKEKGFL